MMVMRYWFGRIPIREEFSLRTNISVEQQLSSVSIDNKNLWTQFDRLDYGSWVSTNLFPLPDPRFLDFFCMTEPSLCFRFFLSHYLATLSIADRRMGGWTSFFYTSQIQAYLHLMTRLCSMIAWNGLIFRDGVAIAWAGTVKKIPFHLLGPTGAIKVVIKRGLAGKRSSKTFHMRSRLKN